MPTPPIPYQKGTPDAFGVYAVRVPCPHGSGMLTDMFLIWDSTVAHWFYCGSDQRYRGEVVGFLGPLQRKAP